MWELDPARRFHGEPLHRSLLPDGRWRCFFSKTIIGPSWAVLMDIGGEFSGTVSGMMNMGGQIGGALSPTVSLGSW